MRTAFRQTGNVSSGLVRSGSTGLGPIFKDEGERRALLLRMGTGPTAWAYLDTLARAARMSRKALRPKLEALEEEGLVASNEAPAGVRYRLTDEGRRLRAG
jgi:DNA-binding transcriptional ArsR family regulator